MTIFNELRVYAGGEWRVVGAEHDIVTELHTAAGAEAWDVLGASEADTLAWLAATASPGAAAALLRTDDDGHLNLVRLNLSENVVFGDDAGLTRHAANQLGPLAGDAIRSSAYTSGVAGYYIGDDYAEFSNAIIRGELHAAVFVKDLVSAFAGTLIVAKSAGKLAADYTVGGTLTVEDPPGGGWLFDTGDIMYVKAEHATGVGATWITVTRTATMNQYTTAYRSGTNGITYPAGTAVTDWGVSGQGIVAIGADGAIGAAPNLSIMTHAGSPWTAQTLVGRWGNLNGAYGVTGNYQGLGIGDYTAGNYLKYDTDGGFVLKAGDGAVMAASDGLSLTTGTEFNPISSVKFVADGEYLGSLSARGSTLLGTAYVGLDVGWAAVPTVTTRFTLGADGDEGWANLFTDSGTFRGLGIGIPYVEPAYMLDVAGTGRFQGNCVIGLEGGLYVGEAITPIHEARSIIVTGNLRARGGLYVGNEGVSPAAGTITATGTITGNIIQSNDYMVAVGGLRVGSAADPGANNLSVAGVATIGDYLVAVGGLRVGSSSDPGANNLSVAGYATISDFLAAPGGVHVGGTSDPGTDRLIVDGHARIGQGLNVGTTGADAAAGMVIATAGASGWLLMAAYGCVPANMTTNQTPFMATISRSCTLRSVHLGLYIGTTNNASNYWRIYLKKINNVTLATMTSAAVAAGTWAVVSASALDTALDTSDIAIHVSVEKVGNPGPLYMSGPAVYVS